MTLCPCPKIGNREVVRSSPKFTTYLLQSFVWGGLFTYLNGHKGRVGWVGQNQGAPVSESAMASVPAAPRIAVSRPSRVSICGSISGSPRPAGYSR